MQLLMFEITKITTSQVRAATLEQPFFCGVVHCCGGTWLSEEIIWE